MDHQVEHPGDDVVRRELRARIDDLVAVYRFGSSARGQTHRQSDVDIAVLARAPLDPAVRFDLLHRRGDARRAGRAARRSTGHARSVHASREPARVPGAGLIDSARYLPFAGAGIGIGMGIGCVEFSMSRETSQLPSAPLASSTR